MKTKFISNNLPKDYSSPIPVSGLKNTRISKGRQYTLLGQSTKKYDHGPRVLFGLRALAKTVFTGGIGLFFGNTRVDWKVFLKGKKVIVVYQKQSVPLPAKINSQPQQNPKPQPTPPKQESSNPNGISSFQPPKLVITTTEKTTPQTQSLAGQLLVPEKKDVGAATPTSKLANVATAKPAAPEKPKKVTVIHPLPQAKDGVIKNGYGEYLVYRLNLQGEKEAVNEKDFEEAMTIIEAGRALKGDEIPNDRHEYLQTQLRQKLGDDLHISFIPRTLYELIYLKECVNEEIESGRCSNSSETGVEWLFTGASNRVQLFESGMEAGFWQQCEYRTNDYLSDFAPRQAEEAPGLPEVSDYRPAHLLKIAAKLNEVALKTLQSAPTENAFTYGHFQKALGDLTDYFKAVHNPKSEIHSKVLEIWGRTYLGIARAMAEETTTRRGNADSFPMGIYEDRHLEIVEKAMQLECSAEADSSMIFYRGSEFDTDRLLRKEFSFGDRPELPNTLSLGNSLFAGAVNDGGATSFHFMRNKRNDAQAYVVPIKEQFAGNTAFHAYNVHPLVGLLSRGEIFHARTKLWKVNPKDKVMGYLGYGSSTFENIPAPIISDMTQQEIEESFQKFKDKAYILAPGG